MDVDMLPVLLTASAIAVVGATFVVRRAQRRTRQREIEPVARDLGWAFRAGMDTQHRARYAAFDVFQHGLGGHARDTAWGTLSIGGLEHPAKLGDFLQVHDDPSGMRRQRRHFSYLIVHLPYPDARTLTVSPTSHRGGPRPGEPLGDGELAFERDDPLRSFTFTCSDPALPPRLFDPTVIALLRTLRTSVTVVAGRLCIADGERCWSADEFRARLRLAGELLARWAR